MAMIDEHRERLRKNQVELVKHLDIDELFLSCMMVDNIITDEMKEEIQVGRTRQARSSTFLSILPKRGANAFERFIKTLVDTEHDEDLIKNLDPDYKFHEQPVIERQTSAPSLNSAFVTADRVDSVVDQIKKKPTDVTIQGFSEIDGRTNAGKPVYPMKNPCHGKAVIIRYGVNSTGDASNADADSRLLGNLFQNLNFEVKNFSESNEKGVVEKLTGLQQTLEKQSVSDEALVVVILCTGEATLNYDKITTLFDGHNCKKMRGSPKLFFFQDSKRLQQMPSNTPLAGSSSASSDLGDNHDTPDGGELSSSSSDSSLNKKEHEKQHQHIVRFSDCGIVAGSGTTVCVTALAQCISHYGSQCELYDLLLMVDNVVRKLCEVWKYQIRGVVLQKNTTLKHDFYFRP